MYHNFLKSTSINLLDCPGVFEFDGTDLYKKKEFESRNVYYTLNSYGYRCPEFETIDWQNSIITLGCSHTYGIGLTDTSTYSSKLSEILDIPVINLGQGGTGIWYQVKNIQTLSLLNPKYVVLQIPDVSRVTTFLSEGETINIGPWSTKSFGKIYYEVYNKYETNTDVYSDFALDYINKLLPNGLTYSFTFTGRKNIDKARDQMHAGPETNQIIANEIADYFKSSVLI